MMFGEINREIVYVWGKEQYGGEQYESNTVWALILQGVVDRMFAGANGVRKLQGVQSEREREEKGLKERATISSRYCICNRFNAKR
ncbi:hypothetical protein DPMN_151628 [Dreissena polymorpha]|uniref:Uncharacterized protein n=1 Tax=Dreissena polymorpha TaxID=45954 RepID=A0A9D4FFQ0_DREPO|nr:hypothetical protein DPMN_151628 [Dreissena polymorpha]